MTLVTLPGVTTQLDQLEFDQKAFSLDHLIKTEM